MRRRVVPLLVSTTLVLGVTAGFAAVAGADSQTTSNAPLTCQTRFGAQAGAYTVTLTDDVDPATAGGAVSYRMTSPFKQTLPGGLAGSYKGGQVYWHIPAGLNVTSVSTQQPAGGSPLTATAAKQGNDIVVTTSGSIPIDGASHPTPDLLVQATAATNAGGTQVKWLIPFHIIANVDVNGVGPVDADCAPNNPNTVVGTTTVQVPGNRSPVVKNQSVPVTQNTAKVVTLTATDADGDAVTFSTGSVKHGTLSLSANKATYTPDTGFLGDDFFDYTASDGKGGSASARVSLDVHAPAEGDTYPPTIALQTPAKGAVYTPGQVVRAAFTCADDETGMQSCTGTVANGAALSTTLGRHSFLVTAKDNGGNTTQSFVSYQVVSRTPVAQSYTAIANSPNVIPITCNQTVVPFDQRIPAPVAAPAQVPEGDTFVFRISPGSMSVLPSTVATNAKYIVAAPAGGTITDVRVVPGTGTANAANSTASVVSGKAVLTVPAVDGGLTGTTFTPRQMEVTIRATAVPTAPVTTKFDRFQVRLTTGQAGVNIVTTDYDCPGGSASAPNPTLTRTTAIDVTPPVVALTTPVHGGRYLVGDSVPANFGCTDNHGVASCVGTVANGQPVTTASSGAKQFTVTATDAAGNVAMGHASYKVFTPVAITTAFTNADAALMQSASQFFNIPFDKLPAAFIYYLHVGLATNFNPAQVGPPPPGARPVIITTNWLPNTAALVRFDASRYGLSGEDYHWFAGRVAAALYLLWSPH